MRNAEPRKLPATSRRYRRCGRRPARSGRPHMGRRARNRRVREPQGRAAERRVPERWLLDHVNEVNALVLVLIGLAERHFRSAPRQRHAARGVHPPRRRQSVHPAPDAVGRDRVRRRLLGPRPRSRRRGACRKLRLPAGVCELIRHHAPFNYDGHLPPTVEGTILHYADLAAADLAAIRSARSRSMPDLGDAEAGPPAPARRRPVEAF